MAMGCWGECWEECPAIQISASSSRYPPAKWPLPRLPRLHPTCSLDKAPWSWGLITKVCLSLCSLCSTCNYTVLNRGAMEVKVGEENHHTPDEWFPPLVRVVQLGCRVGNGFNSGAPSVSGRLKWDPSQLSAWLHSTSKLHQKGTWEWQKCFILAHSVTGPDGVFVLSLKHAACTRLCTKTGCVQMHAHACTLPQHTAV